MVPKKGTEKIPTKFQTVRVPVMTHVELMAFKFRLAMRLNKNVSMGMATLILTKVGNKHFDEAVEIAEAMR
jgi:hypothetical protein